MHQVGKIYDDLVEIKFLGHRGKLHLIEIIAFDEGLIDIGINDADKVSRCGFGVDDPVGAIVVDVTDLPFRQDNLPFAAPMIARTGNTD